VGYRAWGDEILLRDSLQFFFQLDYADQVDYPKKGQFKITQTIEKWFAQNARPLPWRETSTPWGRLMSEFMAQQTQIDRVAERWPRMMERFPNPESMASCDERDVLSIWQGLGYYRRAKYLKATAKMIEIEFDGRVPSDVDSLLKLPGIGRYTAGAIASMAFGERVPIVDGNVHRVFCRLWDKSNEPVTGKWTWNVAEELVQQCDNPQVFNEGIMEFGATVCTPKVPSCESCPLQKHCVSYQKGTQHEIPTPKKSPTKKRVHHYAVVMEKDNCLAFEQRGNAGLWAGMWQVPTVESTKKLSAKQVSQRLKIGCNLHLAGEFEHILSHRIISFTVFSCKGTSDTRYSWLKHDVIEELPLASAQRKVLVVHCAT
jgi:A/G-specific adenine glycosylase